MCTQGMFFLFNVSYLKVCTKKKKIWILVCGFLTPNPVTAGVSFLPKKSTWEWSRHWQRWAGELVWFHRFLYKVNFDIWLCRLLGALQTFRKEKRKREVRHAELVHISSVYENSSYLYIQFVNIQGISKQNSKMFYKQNHQKKINRTHLIH